MVLLYRKNVSYASTCNLVGFSLGIFFGSVCSILLTSEEFHRKLLWKTSGSGGIITMKSKYANSGTKYFSLRFNSYKIKNKNLAC